MDINEQDYILGYWFAEDKNRNCWYLMIKKQKEGWEGQYTFSYASSNLDPFSGEDKKSIYTMAAVNETEEETLRKCNEIFEFIKMTYNNFSDFFLVRGGSDKFLEIARTKHYLHLKEKK